MNNTNTNTNTTLNNAWNKTKEVFAPFCEAGLDCVDILVETTKMTAGTTLVVTSHTKAAMEEVNALLPQNQDEAKALVARNKARFNALFETEEDTEGTDKPRMRAAS